jgi:RNA polymerase sigma-70 factor (ECF subfamily)
VAVLARLDSYRGDSRFTTWAYKFALLEAAVAVRRRAWQERELPVAEERWSALGSDGPSAQQGAEARELLSALREAVDRVLSERQREVLTALALNEVPIDVLAERLATTRGALYKSLHDARRKIREELGRRGLDPSAMGGTA